MLQQDFEKLVADSVVLLPKHIQKAMDNVAIVVEQSPSAEELKQVGTRVDTLLLGLYQGVPKTTWGRGFGQILPDKITIFQESIEKLASLMEDITELVRLVVWHEIAHHFGFKEKKIHTLEAKWRKRLSKEIYLEEGI